uniref:Uncharacterized protein n=1 Tax=Megaselia scalaris TaxID=36166 RepID=T1GY84_MEGSC
MDNRREMNWTPIKGYVLENYSRHKASTIFLPYKRYETGAPMRHLPSLEEVEIAIHNPKNSSAGSDVTTAELFKNFKTQHELQQCFPLTSAANWNAERIPTECGKNVATTDEYKPIMDHTNFNYIPQPIAAKIRRIYPGKDRFKVEDGDEHC